MVPGNGLCIRCAPQQPVYTMCTGCPTCCTVTMSVRRRGVSGTDRADSSSHGAGHDQSVSENQGRVQSGPEAQEPHQSAGALQGRVAGSYPQTRHWIYQNAPSRVVQEQRMAMYSLCLGQHLPAPPPARQEHFPAGPAWGAVCLPGLDRTSVRQKNMFDNRKIDYLFLSAYGGTGEFLLHNSLIFRSALKESLNKADLHSEFA